jgi:hypothetical protein
MSTESVLIIDGGYMEKTIRSIRPKWRINYYAFKRRSERENGGAFAAVYLASPCLPLNQR